jgi:hypothetical protein
MEPVQGTLEKEALAQNRRKTWRLASEHVGSPVIGRSMVL